ncbi:MAG: TetR/AcrR family transcriptional regulator C-terminal domain-containing protein [Pseudomonadota bacterium]
MDQATDEKKPVRAGRPVDEAKTERIKDEAKKLFFTHGVDGVSIEQIAAAAKVAKTTVYAKFGNKDAVFQAVVDDIAENVGAGMKTSIAEGADPQDALCAFGSALMTGIAERRLLTAEPVIAIEALKNPELGEKFFAAGPGRAKAMLAKALTDWQHEGKIGSSDPAEMAEDLLGLWLGTLVYEMRLKPHLKISPAEIKARVTRGVGKFLRIHGSGA